MHAVPISSSSRKLSTMKAPVLFSAEVATGIFGHLVAAISGSMIYRESSCLLDSLGKTDFPQWLNIQERPHIVGGLASTPFDSEGYAHQMQILLKMGTARVAPY